VNRIGPAHPAGPICIRLSQCRIGYRKFIGICRKVIGSSIRLSTEHLHFAQEPSMSPSAWRPCWNYNDRIVQALTEIASASAAVEQHAWSPVVEEEIRFRARLRSTHFSTRIEGNRLTLAQAEEVVRGRQVKFAGRERDVKEVDNYWHAMLQVEAWGRESAPLSEEMIRKLHAIVERGSRRKASEYRTLQNVIKDSGSGRIVYLPPEAKDVPQLMARLVEWIRQAEKAGIPVPVIAGLAHYQFVTIHPFMDGNGRTARLLATLILHRLGLRGFYSLEEHHARDIATYYNQLSTHEHHNDYEGREEVDLTPWVEYFTGTVARVFSIAADEAIRASRRRIPAEPEPIRELDARARRVLALFSKTDSITAADVSRILPISDRAVRNHVAQWVAAGFLVVQDPSNRARKYGLSEVYRQYIGRLSERAARGPAAREQNRPGATCRADLHPSPPCQIGYRKFIGIRRKVIGSIAAQDGSAKAAVCAPGATYRLNHPPCTNAESSSTATIPTSTVRTIRRPTLPASSASNDTISRTIKPSAARSRGPRFPPLNHAATIAANSRITLTGWMGRPFSATEETRALGRRLRRDTEKVVLSRCRTPRTFTSGHLPQARMRPETTCGYKGLLVPYTCRSKDKVDNVAEEYNWQFCRILTSPCFATDKNTRATDK
jgi:Fic family protein